MHVIEWNQNKNKVMSHSNWPLVLLSDLADKQCNGIIKDFTVWCQIQKEYFLNMLLALCLVMAQI